MSRESYLRLGVGPGQSIDLFRIRAKKSVFICYIPLFNPKKCDIENSSYLPQSYNANFALNRADIGPISGVILYIIFILTAC